MIRGGSEETITDLLMSRWKHPANVSVVCAERAHSYAELSDDVNEASSTLESFGVEHRDRVLLVSGNSYELIVLLLAIMKIGALEVTLHPNSTPRVLQAVIEQVEPRLVVGDVSALPLLPGRRWIDMGGCLAGTSVSVAPGGQRSVDKSDVFAQMAADGVVTIQFTSGTTGQPKGIALTASSIAETVFAAEHLRSHEGQRLFLGLPICNSYGKTQLLEFLYCGAQINLDNGFGHPEEFWAKLDQTRSSVLEAPPSVCELLIRSQSFQQKGLSELRRIGMAGGKIRGGLLSSLRQRLPECEITNRYGVTEISGGLCRTSLSDEDIASGAITCGRPLKGVSLRIVDSEGSYQPDGEVGEIVVRSPGLMWGVFPEKYAGDEFRTGDAGYFDGEGRLVLVDRLSGMIKRDGVRIFPREIEQVIEEMTAVRQCVVLGIDNSRTLREEVVAAVVLRDGANTQSGLGDVRAWCHSRLASDRRPDRLISLPEIPLAPTGKPDFRLLRELAGSPEPRA